MSRVRLSILRQVATSAQLPTASVFSRSVDFGVQLKVLLILSVLHFGAKFVWR